MGVCVWYSIVQCTYTYIKVKLVCCFYAFYFFQRVANACSVLYTCNGISERFGGAVMEADDDRMLRV